MTTALQPIVNTPATYEQRKALKAILESFQPPELRSVLHAAYGKSFLDWLPSEYVGAGELRQSTLVHLEKLNSLERFFEQMLLARPLEDYPEAHQQILKVQRLFISSHDHQPPRDHSRNVVPERPHKGQLVGLLVQSTEDIQSLQTLLPSMQALRIPELGGWEYRCVLSTASDCPLTGIITCVGSAGLERAALATERFLQRWSPQLVLDLGLATAMRLEQNLGDIAVIDQVDLFLASVQAGSTQSIAESDMPLQHSGRVYRPTHALVEDVLQLPLAHPSLVKEWHLTCAQEYKRLQQEAMARDIQSEVAPYLLQQLERSPDGDIQSHSIPTWSESRLRRTHLASSGIKGTHSALIRWLTRRDSALSAADITAGGVLESIYTSRHTPRILSLRALIPYAETISFPSTLARQELQASYARFSLFTFALMLMRSGLLSADTSPTHLETGLKS